MLFAGVFCILLVLFLLKPLAIFLIAISSISVYFMQAYGAL
ncbi:phosphoethanolamine transferase domain-containing protein [Campylobacter concisus]